MKLVKKLLSLAVCLMMAFSLVTVVTNADSQQFTISTKAGDGHTYSVYQIFTGDVDSNGVLSNVKWGANGKGTTGDAVDKTLLEALSQVSSDELSQRIFENVDILVDRKAEAIAYLNNSEKTIEYTDNGVQKTDHTHSSITVPAGYYVIMDVDGTGADDDNYSRMIVQVVKDYTINPKLNKTPTVVKKVDDINDSNTTEDSVVWQDSADYDIGDLVPFKLTVTLGELTDYNYYYLAIIDTLSKGLTYDSIQSAKLIDAVTKVETDISGYVNQTFEIGNDETYQKFGVSTTTNDDHTTTLKYQFDDVKTIGADSNDTIEIIYYATLNENAVIGNQGNPNKVYLEYSNNPLESHCCAGKNSTGKTPEDKVIVFTYKVVVNKIKEDKSALVGASFKLEKVLKDGTKKDLGTVNGTDLSTFEWKGIDDGNYILTETVTPAGYNTIDPITFTVSATHDLTWETQEQTAVLTSLSGGDLGNGSVDTGAVTGDITNYTGATLPTTGGMGTTMIYIGGASLMAVAAILLISKKRMAIK